MTMEAQDLKKAGLKATLPRLRILEIMEDSNDKHMSAEDIYKSLLDAGEEVGLATVYRVLTQFESAGLVIRHNFDSGHSVFETDRGTHHDRMVCLKTGKVIVQLIPFILLLPNSLFKIVASSMIKIDPTARSSMYEDFMLGRHTEIDYLNGEIVDLAKHLNIPSPVNSAIMNLVKTAEKQSNGSPMISAKELLNQIVG